MALATLTAESVFLLMMIGISAIWLILDQLARVLKRGRATIALRAELERLAAEREAAAAQELHDDQPLRAAA